MAVILLGEGPSGQLAQSEMSTLLEWRYVSLQSKSRSRN